MLKISQRLYNAREEGSAMVFALIVLMIALMVTLTVAAFTITTLQTSKVLNAESVYDQATDSALNNALLVANSEGGSDKLETRLGDANAVTGSLDAARTTYGSKWRWYAERVAVSGKPVSYYIYATAYSTIPTEADAKTERALLVPRVVSGASVLTVPNGTGTPQERCNASVTSKDCIITYQSSDGAIFQWGLLAMSGATTGGATFGTYSSQPSAGIPATLKPDAEIASVGNLNLSDTTGLSVFNQFGDGALSTRCSGTICPDLDVAVQDYSISLEAITARVQAECPLAASSYPNWTASANGGQLLVTSTVKCFNQMNFDANTSLPAYNTPQSPARVFAKGNITVQAGVDVNTNGRPTSLQLFGAQTAVSSTFIAGTAANPTVFNGLMAGQNLDCKTTGSGTTKTVNLYGSLACDKFNFGANVTVGLDSESYTAKSTDDRRIWSFTKYETLY